MECQQGRLLLLAYRVLMGHAGTCDVQQHDAMHDASLLFERGACWEHHKSPLFRAASLSWVPYPN